MTHTAHTLLSAADADALAADAKRRWRAGGVPDAAAVLEAHPDLAAYKSIVLDLAYEEFCLRRERGDAPNVASLCGRMPADFRGSIGIVLQAHELVEDHADRLTTDAAGWPEPGTRFAGMQVAGELGSGSFARAYLAFDPGTDRLCVLKLSPTGRGEGRTLGRHAHPRITPVLWAELVGGFNAVCMPLLGAATLDQVRRHVFPTGSRARPASSAALLDAVDAVPLTRLIDAPGPAAVRRAEPYPWAVGRIALGVAEGLRYLHQKGARHGDLKPSNVVLGPGGRPYLIDFNLADPGDDPAAVGGTLPYMAPEQLRLLAGVAGAPVDAAKADVHAFALVVAELLTGVPPAAADLGAGLQAAAARQLVLRGAVAWPADLPPAVAVLFDRCLAADPAARPTSADVATALERWLSPPAVTRSRRERLAAAALLLLPTAAVTLAVARGADWSASSAVAPPALAPPARPPETAEEFYAHGREFLAQEAPDLALSDFRRSNALRPDGHTLAFAAYSAARLGLHQTAWDLSGAARKEGYTTPAVLNNAAYAALGLKRTKDARAWLTEALEGSPDLTAARYNRAFAGMEFRLRPDRHVEFVAGGATCLEDIRAALAGRVQCGELYYTAARIYALASAADPRHVETAQGWVARAAEAGVPLSWCVDDQILKANLGMPAIRAAFAATQPARMPPTPHELCLVIPD